MIRTFSLLLLVVFLTSACAPQQAAFLSEPAGAKVLVDGVEIGQTPCRFDYRLSPGNSHTVTLDKEGFEPIEFVVKADEVDTESRNRWLTAGLVWSPLWLGTLFTKKFKDSYDFMLREASPAMTARTGNGTDNGSSL